MKKNNYIFIIFAIFITFFMNSCKSPKNDIKLEVTKIEVSEDSILQSFENEYSLSNLFIIVTYSNNKTEKKIVTKNMITLGLDKLDKEGTHEIEITYEKKSVKVEIEIVHIKAINISVSNKSTLVFEKGNVSLDEIFIKVLYSDNTECEIPLSQTDIISDIKVLEEVGTQEIKVQYEGISTTVTVTINDVLTVKEILLSNNAKTSFLEGEFDISKIIIDVLYSNNTSSSIQLNDNMITSGFIDGDLPGKHSLEISYFNQTLTIDITIVESEVKYFKFEKTTIDYEECYMVVDYIGAKSYIEIPSMYLELPVKAISERAFFGNDKIVKVTIPNTVVTIGEAAFYKCSSLKTIIIPSSVTNIETYALRGVKTIYFESSQIDETWYDVQNTYANQGVNLETIQLTENGDFEYYINSDNQLVLSNYYGTNNIVNIPAQIKGMDVTVLGGACFKGCMDIEEISMPNTIIEIEKYGLAGCENLTKLHLPSKLEVLGDYAIRGCIKLKNLVLPNTLKKIGANAFNMCSELKEMIIPEGVTYIGGYAFSWCINLSKIYIPLSVITIQVGACYSCSSATIYLAHSSIPSTWETGWNMSNRPIIYNSTNI